MVKKDLKLITVCVYKMFASLWDLLALTLGTGVTVAYLQKNTNGGPLSTQKNANQMKRGYYKD